MIAQAAPTQNKGTHTHSHTCTGRNKRRKREARCESIKHIGTLFYHLLFRLALS